VSNKPPRFCELLQHIIRIVSFAPEIGMVQITFREKDHPYIAKKIIALALIKTLF
jgi:hypothetical protein